MLRLFAIGCLLLAAACTSPPQTGTAGHDTANFDTCLLTNMAAVRMLEDGIAETEDFLTRAKMTAEAYASMQEDLAYQRSAIERLLELRSDMLRDETLDESEQAARTSTLMQSYAGGADAMIAKATANNESGLDLAVKATICAGSLEE